VPQILLKRTNTQNPPTGLAAGEAAWSENGFLYMGRADGSVVPIAQVSGLLRVASEVLFAGALVNMWNNNGTESVRLANANTGHSAHGYVLGAVAAGASTFVVTTYGGINRQARAPGGAALVTGEYALSGDAGRIVPIANAPPSSLIYQQVGMVSGADLVFNPGMVIWR
jgi:hypothetical protein